MGSWSFFTAPQKIVVKRFIYAKNNAVDGDVSAKIKFFSKNFNWLYFYLPIHPGFFGMVSYPYADFGLDVFPGLEYDQSGAVCFP
jgi:hypothetical protein